MINLLTEHIQQQPLIHMDKKLVGTDLDNFSWPRSGEPQGWVEQSILQVLDEPGKPAQSKSYLWLMATFGM